MQRKNYTKNYYIIDRYYNGVEVFYKWPYFIINWTTKN